MLHFDIQVALELVPLLQPHLSMRFISWSPSPLRKRSRLAGSIKQEQRASKRFSIISCSSAVDGLWRLNTWEGRRRREHLERTPRKACCSYMRRKEWGRQIIITWQKILARVAEQLRERRGDRVENTVINNHFNVLLLLAECPKMPKVVHYSLKMYLRMRR